MGHLQDFISLHDPPGRSSSLGRPNPVSYPVSSQQYYCCARFHDSVHLEIDHGHFQDPETAQPSRDCMIARYMHSDGRSIVVAVRDVQRQTNILWCICPCVCVLPCCWTRPFTVDLHKPQSSCWRMLSKWYCFSFPQQSYAQKPWGSLLLLSWHW